jgi:excisionase family DNA binding protein
VLSTLNFQLTNELVPQCQRFPALADLMDIQTSEWLTANEAACYLKIKPRTLLQWARQGTVKGYILSGTLRQTWRFLHADLDATLTTPSVALKRRIQ